MALRSLVRCLATVAVATFALAACATEDEPDDAEVVDQTNDELRSAPLDDKDMVAIAAPAGMPEPWKQPDSEGWFDERGKCGPTALANELKLYGVDKSPDSLDSAGVHFYVGTLQWNIEGYLKKNHADLACKISYPWDGAAALRGQLDGGHPVMVWFNTDGGWSSHWVTAVGHRGTGADEKVIVMSWGRYYEISMKKLDDASKWVYGMRHPTIVCGKSTDKIVK